MQRMIRTCDMSWDISMTMLRAISYGKKGEIVGLPIN